MAPFPRATHTGMLEFSDMRISCSVLENGARILNTTNMYAAFGRKKGGKSKLPSTFNPIVPKNLVQYVADAREKGLFDSIQYVSVRGKQSEGFKAEIIVAVCEAYLKARDESALLSSQQHLAQLSEIIVRSLAKTGIIALVDEATGYQYDREKDALQKILKQYILEDFLPWQARFPREYYRQLFRLYGLNYNPYSVKRPQYLGGFTNKYVYGKLPPGVLDELRKKNPERKVRHHQFLTPDTGIAHLDKHLNKLVTVMQLSKNLSTFEANFDQVFDKSGAI